MSLKGGPLMRHLVICQSGLRAKNAFDTGSRGEVSSRTGYKSLFQQCDDGFVSFGPCGGHTGAFSGSGEPASDRSPVQGPPERQGRRIIPVHI